MKSILKIEELTLKNILRDFLIFIQNSSAKDYASFFDTFLYHILDSNGVENKQNLQPKELTRFMCSLVDISKKSRIYNPFAGYGSFPIYIKNFDSLLSEEINNKTFLIGALRTSNIKKGLGEGGSLESVLNNSLKKWPNKSKKI